MPLQLSEILFVICVYAFTFIYFLFFKNITWEQFGLKSIFLLKGWRSIFLFTLLSFVLIQVIAPKIDLPSWFIDQDPIIPLILVVAAQEILFRSFALNWLAFLGEQRALIIVTILFASIHLVHASPWFVTTISLLGGYFWGWHFYKNRNLYLLILSHLAVNLSFNYFIL